MRLVDILARELKEWPFTERRLGQASDGSLHAEPFTGGHTAELYTLADDYPEAVVPRAKWQAAVDALKSGDQAWNGKWLPPVGTVCEAKMPPQGLKLPGSEWVWRRVEVVRHNDGIRSAHREFLVFDLDSTTPAWVDEIRAIRTAEQIAAEERSREIGAMVDACSNPEWVTTYETCAAIYDAGYRKQVQP